jgi:hypothetical protein
MGERREPKQAKEMVKPGGGMCKRHLLLKKGLKSARRPSVYVTMKILHKELFV